ncbi:MAG: hypothetical protein Q9175_001269 [Cornicularia normoerica]
MLFYTSIEHLHPVLLGKTWQERRNLVLASVEAAGFGWWIVLVAGIGFLTDAYDIFSINTIIPMLSIVYWEGNFPTEYSLGMNIATLVGSMVGQVVFGFLADRYGRRKMYGLELIVTITASFGFATASTGVSGSMSLIAMLIFWRLVMGIGIGNEAMHAKDYFTSSEDLGHDDRGSVHMDVFEHTPKAAANGHHIANGLQIPQPTIQSNLQGQGLSDDSATNSIGPTVEELEDPHPSQASRADLYKYLFTDGNWTDLFATAVNWMLLDFIFYLLGVNSSSFVRVLFGQTLGKQLPPYNWLISNERDIMESTSIGALIGSAMAFFAMHFYSRKRIQMWGFLILGGLFIIVGALYMTLPSTNAHVAIVVFYGICQLFYNLGKFYPLTSLTKCRGLLTLQSRSEHHHFHRKRQQD